MPNPPSEDKQLKWKAFIEEQRQSGLSIEKWCLQNQIKRHLFHYWKDKLYPKQLQKNSFAELNAKRPDVISLQACGVQIRIDSGCNFNLRKQLFALFMEGSC